MKKSLCDKRTYKMLNLQNSLKVLLVKDPEADTSSASMGVRVGSFSDPKEYAGLAHFCEHMLFMGNKKYPSSNEFSEYLNKNNGYSNAFTDSNATVYYFKCKNEAFEGALDRFSQFFIEPSFDISTVEKELSAIQSEHDKNKQSDVWRHRQLIRSESRPETVVNHFSTGDKSTINKNNDITEPRNALIEFFKNYYHACKMNLVLDSPFELNVMEEYVKKMFSAIQQGDNKELNYKREFLPYDSTNSRRFYSIKGIADKNKIKFNWNLESFEKEYKVNPLKYFSSLFGHESKNTLLYSLIQDGLATELTGSGSSEADIYSNISISITLTDKGLQSLNEIIKRTLKYVRSFQLQPISKRFFDENRMINQISFDYKNREDPIDYTCSLSYVMHLYEENDILPGMYGCISEYDENLINKILQSLNLDNLNIYLTTKNEDFLKNLDRVEPWYKTEFKYSKIDEVVPTIESDLKSFKLGDKICEHKLDFPDENIFLPKSLEVKKLEHMEFPKLIKSDDRMEVWYKSDTTFLKPKVVIYCQIYLDKTIFPFIQYESIAYTWNLVIEAKLKDIAYMAQEANVSFNLYFNAEGIMITIDGFSDSIHRTVELLLDEFKNINLKDNLDLLEINLEKQIREMSNFYLQNPYTVAFGYFDYLRLEPSAPANKKLMVLLHLQEKFKKFKENKNSEELNKFSEFVSNFLNKSYFLWTLQGNLTEKESIDLAETVSKSIRSETLDQTDFMSIRVVDQEANTCYSYKMDAINPNELNNCIVSVFSNKYGELKEKLKMSLLVSLLKEKFFDSLRTEQGLGYIVQCFLREQRKINSIIFLVQSSIQTPEYIRDRINEFLEQNHKRLSELNDEEFEEHRNSLISEYKIKDLGLESETVRNYNEIKKRSFNFDIKQQSINILGKITKKEVLEAFNFLFKEEVRRLDIMYVSANKKEKFNEEILENLKKEERRYFIEDINDYKKRNNLHKDYFMKEYKNNTKF